MSEERKYSEYKRIYAVYKLKIRFLSGKVDELEFTEEKYHQKTERHPESKFGETGFVRFEKYDPSTYTFDSGFEEREERIMNIDTIEEYEILERKVYEIRYNYSHPENDYGDKRLESKVQIEVVEE